MWSYTFTSTRSQLFNEEHRLGLHAEAPGARRAFSSEGAMREVMRGAILPQNLEGAIVGAAATGCRFLLCDRGSEFTVREILADMLSSVDRAKFRIVARLSADCHAGQDAAARQCLQMMRELGLEYLDGCIVPWPGARARANLDGDAEPAAPRPDRATCNEETSTFLQSWKAVTALVQAGKVRCLGVSELGLWQLQRVTEPAGILRPTFHLIGVSLRSAQHDVVRWCHSRAIEIVAFLEASPTVLRSEPHQKVLQKVVDETGYTPAQVTISWALQHGLVTIPQLGSLIKDPGSIASDDVYRQWLSAMAEKLREIYSLLHPFTRRPKFCSPTRIRQVTLSKDQVAALDDLDAVRIATRKHIESTLAQWATTADTDPLGDGDAPPPDDAPEAITVELAGELLDAPDEAEAGPGAEPALGEFLPAF